MTTASGPGKTSPKLYQDFLIFDPARSGATNILAGHPPPQGSGVQPAPDKDSCSNHDYTIKQTQSILPPLDLRPDGSTVYKAAVVCKKCRIHADIRLDHSYSANPCPTSTHPLHHFQRVSSYDETTAQRIRYAWQCSAEGCHALLFICYRRPRISAADLDLLTNAQLLRRRFEELFEDDPERGYRQATELEPLMRLRRYIQDALDSQRKKRSITARNARFQEAFGMNGQDCGALLGGFGFKYADGAWILPDPEDIHDRSQATGLTERELLEDVERELYALVSKVSAVTGLDNPLVGETWPSAKQDIERTFAAQGYSRCSALQRSGAWDSKVAYYNSLGALTDFSDSLIDYAYDRQLLCDPELQAYYFECLQEISEARVSEDLQVKVAAMQSQDVVSRRDITAAYRCFNLGPYDGKNTNDERLLSLYQARQSDSSAAAQEDARDSLYKLGIARGSTLLVNASRQSVDSYADALAWLGNGVDKTTPDEGLLAVLAIKTSDNKQNEEIGQKAISSIAKARQSNLLNTWLLTGRTDGYNMSVDEALRHLNIEQKLELLEPTLLPAIFESARQDRPGDTTEKAITTIQHAMSTTSMGAASHTPEAWPVGLTSHGNTCYLNSLLQYYFSITPLRDIVLNYEQYKLDTSQYAAKEERVGQRKVSPVEILGGQRFAEDLRQLFERMMKSPDSAVKPEEDLVCRAFLDPQQYRLLDPNFKVGLKRGEESAIVNGDQETDNMMVNNEIVASPTEDHQGESLLSATSDATTQTAVNQHGQNISHVQTELPPTPPASPGLQGMKPEPIADAAPPPLPPRRFSTTKEEALDIAKAKARQQQDVTEVHDGSIFRLRCGMMPRGRDAGEEQEDQLRDLFSMQIEDTIVNNGVEQTPKILADTNIQLNVPYEPTDIYSALDAVFDLQPYGESQAIETFKSIRALPALLQINIPRIGYSSAGGAYKSTECVRLDDELYLDRYLSGVDNNTLPKRRKCWAWRKQLQALRTEHKVLTRSPMDLAGPEIIKETADYLTSLDNVNQDLFSIDMSPIEADGDITPALTADAQEQAAHVASLDIQIRTLKHNLNTEFANLQNVKYRLAAVFFHRGAHGHGHYWIYIHDFANDIWRMYNDERVEEFTKLDEIFEAKTWQQGTPTYAVYVADDQKEMVQPVCREIEKVATPEQVPAPSADVDMESVEPGFTPGEWQADGSTINPQVLEQQQPWDAERPSLGDHVQRPTRQEEGAPTDRRVKFAGEHLSDEAFAEMLQKEEFELPRFPLRLGRRTRSDSSASRKRSSRDSLEALPGSPPKQQKMFDDEDETLVNILAKD